MKISVARVLQLVTIASVASVTAFVQADPIKLVGGPVLGGGTIKTSHGDDPGTLKGVAKMRLYCPKAGQFAPPQIAMSFDIFSDSDDPRSATHFHLTGLGRPTPGHLTTWSIMRDGNRLMLLVDGMQVDKVDSPIIGKGDDVVVCFESSTFDRSLYPYGQWTAKMQMDRDKITDPIVVLAPGPALPIPVPKP